MKSLHIIDLTLYCNIFLDKNYIVYSLIRIKILWENWDKDLSYKKAKNRPSKLIGSKCVYGFSFLLHTEQSANHKFIIILYWFHGWVEIFVHGIFNLIFIHFRHLKIIISTFSNKIKRINVLYIRHGWIYI